VSTTIEPFYDISLDLPTVVPQGQTGPISIQVLIPRLLNLQLGSRLERFSKAEKNVFKTD
jgi:hypothetical protein